jgi:hypothetical protein
MQRGVKENTKITHEIGKNIRHSVRNSYMLIRIYTHIHITHR